MDNTTEPDEAVDASMEDRIAAVMMGEPKPQPQKAEPEQPTAEDEGQPSQEGPSPDDLPDDVTPAALQALEIVHNGQSRVLTAQEAKDLAEKGFDYTQKAQALAEERRAIAAMRQAVAAQAQLHPQHLDAIADVKAYERALQAYKDVNWVQKSIDDPIGYPQERARYDQLRDGYQRAAEQAQAIGSQMSQLEAHTRHEQLRAEYAKAVNAVPAWKDPAKFKNDTQAMREYLAEFGYGEDEMSAVIDHRHLQILRDAVAYRNLLKAKAQSQKKVADAPPVAKPGSVQTKSEVNAERDKELTRRIRSERDPRKQERLLAEKFASKF